MSISSLTAIGTPISGRISRHAGIGLPRLQQRPLGVDGGERVQLGIEPLDPAEQLDQLPRGHVAAADQLGLAGHAGERHLFVEHAAILRPPTAPSTTLHNAASPLA